MKRRSSAGLKLFFTTSYEFLTKSDAVEAADLIFVLAGRMERKQYGVELYRAGVAPLLILSVGRFEVSKMHQLDLLGDGALDRLIRLRNDTSPKERNFFVHLTGAGVRFERSELLRSSTYGEAFALRKFLTNTAIRKVLVISTDVHLRRTALTISTVVGDRQIDFRYCPVPSRLSFMTKDNWWGLAFNRNFVLNEFAKLLGYRLILSMPGWISRRLMALKF